MPQKSKKFPLLDTFIWYLNERWSIHQKRLKGLPPPWTDDYALQTYRFCQVRREDDRVTRWIHENWLRPHADDPDLWHAMCVARMFNRIESLEECGWPEPWGRRGTKFLQTALDRKRRGDKVFTAAYTLVGGGYVRYGGAQMTLLEHHRAILDKAWVKRKVAAPCASDTLAAAYDKIVMLHGFGGFMAAQVIADVKWGNVLRSASDFDEFVVMGPGSARGLARLCGREPSTNWRGGEADWYATLLNARKATLPKLPKALRNLDAQNIEHGLCELDKWCRVQDGGRPKQTYTAIQPKYFKETE